MRRHRRVLRDNIQGLTREGFRQMMADCGLKAIKETAFFEELRGFAKQYLEKTERDAITCTEWMRSKRVQTIQSLQTGDPHLFAADMSTCDDPRVLDVTVCPPVGLT